MDCLIAAFNRQRNSALEHEITQVAYSGAVVLSYYPLDEDIRRVLEAEQAGDHYALLDELSRILTGEKAPYTLHKLLSTESDESRNPRNLISDASRREWAKQDTMEYSFKGCLEDLIPGSHRPYKSGRSAKTLEKSCCK